MKNTQTLLYICLVISLLNIFCFLFYFQKKETASLYPATTSFSSAVQPMTQDVYIPEAMNFAGEEVPLHRPEVVEAMRKELIVNTYLHSHTLQILKNAPRTFAILEPILKANGIPEDFKYLAVIESRLEPLITSPAGAVGIWQFMKNTGKEFGLEINSEIDERYHLEKATQAAADYLQKAYNKFGSWTLTAAAYNAGTAMINKQMQLQKEDDYYDLLLGEETERYVFRILALKQIMTHPELYHFQMDETYPVEKTEIIEVKNSVKDWAAFAQEHGITYKTLKRFNPWLRKNTLHNPQHKTYKIKIPKKR